MLIGAGQLVEEGCFAAVLIADQSKGKQRSLRKRLPVFLMMIFAVLAKTGVSGRTDFLYARMLVGAFPDRRHFNFTGVCKAQSQLVAMDLQLHGIAHGGKFHHGCFGSGDDAHIQKMLTKSTFSANPCNHGAFADF